MDFGLIVGGLVVGFVVGLTGMGGGALMTPMLVFFFGVSPLAAVSSDLVTSALMKPFGSAVHLRRGTVNLKLVGWLVIGSVPSAFAGVLILRALGGQGNVDHAVKIALGVALVVASGTLVAKACVSLASYAQARAAGGRRSPKREVLDIVPKPIPTVCIGIVGGLVVGMTSVGSGSLIIIALLLVYPALQAGQLVGTDLVQAVPLVAAAALGHLFFGEFQFGIAASLLVGSIPGVILGAQASARAPGGLIRRALALILLASGLKLLEVSTPITAVLLVASVLIGPLAWMALRRHYGLPALGRREGRDMIKTG